jgi:hypothetical protein
VSPEDIAELRARATAGRFLRQEISRQFKRFGTKKTRFENSMTPPYKRTRKHPGRSLISIYR